MDWNSKAPAEWDWENTAMFTGKPSDHTKGDATENASMYSGFSSPEPGYHTSSLTGGVRTEDVSGEESNRNFSTVGPTAASNEPMIGLKLGRRTYFEDMTASGTTRVTSLSGSAMSSTTKRSRASYQSTQIPCCQVEGCNLELKSAKDYHRRHRICEAHSKSPRVIVAGLERRFCQQCSRFHDLSEFDDKKRSCRRRLSDHNARRRKPHPEPIQFGSTSMSSSSYDGRHQMNFLMNRIPIPVSLPPWQDTSNYKATQLRDAMSMSARSTGSDRGQPPHTSSEDLPHSIPMLHADSDRVLSFQSTSSRVLNHDVAPDLRRALSLLSSNSWGGNEHEPATLEQFRDATQTSIEQPAMHTQLPNGSLSSSQYVQQMEHVPSGSRVQSLDSHSNGGGSQFQEFQLFRGPYEPACFYPYS